MVEVTRPAEEEEPQVGKLLRSWKADAVIGL
jgi:hypothetical protein